MPTLQIQSHISLDDLLDDISQLDTPSLENFSAQILALLAKRKAASLPAEESDLLQKINQGLPLEVQERYDALTAKRRAETITPAEYQELLVLVEQIEQAEAERVQHLIALAQLRQVSLNTLMQDLGIHPPDYA